MRRAATLRGALALGLFLALALPASAQPALDGYARAALRVASADEKRAIEAGTLPQAKLLELAAVGLFGEAALRPIRYVPLKNGLESGGLGVNDLGALVAGLSVDEREKLLAGELTPRDVFAREATRRASWRASNGPRSESDLRALLAGEGELPRLDAALDGLSPLDRDALRAGVMSPARLLGAISAVEEKRPDVIVIGAGMSGLRAAHELTRAGKRVVVLEATDQVGGRVQTDRGTFAGALDMGGAWIHNFFENATAGFAKALGLTLVRDVPKTRLVFDGTTLAPFDKARVTEIQERAALAAEWASKNRRDISVGRALGELGMERNPVLETFVANSYHGVNDFDRLSAMDYAVMTEEVEDRLVKEGMATLTEALQWGTKVKTSTPVEKIEQLPGGGVRVTAGGETYVAKRAIVTTSPAVLASGAIEFSPPLPDWKKDAFSNVRMGKMGKVVVEFSRNVFGDVKPGTRIFDTTRPGGVVEYVVGPFGQNTVVALFGGDMAEDMERKGRDASVAELRDQLVRIFGEQARASFVRGDITAWSVSPFTRGSFSAAEPGRYDAREALGKAVGDIHFAGDAVAPPKWVATIAGAWLSGLKTAGEVLKSLPTAAPSIPARGVERASETAGLGAVLRDRLDERARTAVRR